VHTTEPFQKLVNQGMILGESFRYYDDDVSDMASSSKGAAATASTSKVARYASDQVRETDEGPVAKDDGRPLKARWIQLDTVVYDTDGDPVHPDDANLALERVVEKMSKSKGNVINPDDVIREHGADSMRLYEMFIGPLEKAAPWSTDGIQGIYRFLLRAWRLFHEGSEDDEVFRAPIDGAGTEEQRRLTAQTIVGVTEDLEAMRFNTAISKLMIFARDITRDAPMPRESAEIFLLLLAPMAPHLAEEIWEQLGHETSLAYTPWPIADESLLVEDEITLVLQVNGKKRDEIRVPADISKEAAEARALASPAVQKILDGRAPKKVIVVPGRLVNIVG
jgi:leucyl-tRNA synthetase